MTKVKVLKPAVKMDDRVQLRQRQNDPWRRERVGAIFFGKRRFQVAQIFWDRVDAETKCAQMLLSRFHCETATRREKVGFIETATVVEHRISGFGGAVERPVRRVQVTINEASKVNKNNTNFRYYPNQKFHHMMQVGGGIVFTTIDQLPNAEPIQNQGN